MSIKAKLDELQKWLNIAQQPYAPRFKAARQDAFRMVVNLVPDLLAYVRGLESVSIEAKKERDWYNEASEGRRALVRHLDILMNGEHGAARQAALCDLVAQFPRWLAARDAHQRREGAAEAYENVRSLLALSSDDDLLLAAEAQRLWKGK